MPRFDAGQVRLRGSDPPRHLGLRKPPLQAQRGKARAWVEFVCKALSSARKGRCALWVLFRFGCTVADISPTCALRRMDYRCFQRKHLAGRRFRAGLGRA